MRRSRNPPWSDLPSELSSAIANLLSSNPLDILTFRSICRSWRSSIPNPVSSSSSNLSPQLPLKIPSPPSSLCLNTQFRNTSILSATSVFVLHPPSINENGDSSSSSSSSSSPLMPNSWVLFLDEFNPGKVCVRQPFSDYSYELPLDFPRKLNLMGFEAVFMGRFYNLSYLSNDDPLAKPSFWSEEVLKVVLLDKSSVVLVLFKKGKLGLLRLGVDSMDSQWEVLHDGEGFSFDDIIEFKRKVFGVDKKGRLYEINWGELKINTVCRQMIGGGGRRKRFVESLGVLNLVARCNRGRGGDKIPFKVYGFNEQKKKWIEVTSMGDRIFLFGLKSSLSVPAEEFRGSFGSNCILYKADSFLCYDLRYDDHFLYLGDYDLHMGVWYFDTCQIEDTFPSKSDVFWPPPTWIWPDDESKRFGILETAIDRLLKGMVDQSLKAKLKELSSLAETVVSFGGFIKQITMDMIMQRQMTGNVLKYIGLEIDKEVKSIKKNLVGEAEDKGNRMSIALSQPIFFLRAEKRDSPLPHKSPEPGNDVSDWIHTEWNRRLKTHYVVLRFIEDYTGFLETNSSKFEDLRSLPQEEQMNATLLLLQQWASCRAKPS